MEEIDLIELLNYFKSKWFYILFAISLSFFVSCVYVNQFRTLEYTSYTKVILNQTSTDIISQSDVSLNESLVPNYTEIIKSKLVLNQVIKQLDLDMEYDELEKKVSVSDVTDTSVIEISVTNEDPEMACDIADTITNVFIKEASVMYNFDNISILDEAEIPLESSSTSSAKIICIAILAGAVIACGIIFVFFYFDTTVKSDTEIEKVTGVPVIGIVPLSGLKKKKNADAFEEVDKTSVVKINKIEKVDKIRRKKNEV